MGPGRLQGPAPRPLWSAVSQRDARKLNKIVLRLPRVQYSAIHLHGTLARLDVFPSAPALEGLLSAWHCGKGYTRKMRASGAKPERAACKASVGLLGALIDAASKERANRSLRVREASRHVCRRHWYSSGSCSVPLLLALLAACLGCALLLGTCMEAAGLAKPHLAVRKASSQPGAAAATQRPQRPIQAPRPLEVAVLGQRLSAEHLGMFGAPGAEHAVHVEQHPPGIAEDEQLRLEHGDVGDSNGSKPHAPDDVEAARQELAELQRHVAQHGPAGEFYGTGCRWREVPRAPTAASNARCVLKNRRGAMFGGTESVWGCHSYEYWHTKQQGWSAEQPAACRVQAVPLAAFAAQQEALRRGSNSSRQSSGIGTSTWGLQDLEQQRREREQQQQAPAAGRQHAGGADVATPPGTAARAPAVQAAPARRWRRADVASDSACTTHFCVLRNVWYNNGRFFYLADTHTPPLPSASWQLGRNRANSVLHVRSAVDFATGVDARVVRGETAVRGRGGGRSRRVAPASKPPASPMQRSLLPSPASHVHACAVVPSATCMLCAPCPCTRCWTTTSSCTPGPWDTGRRCCCRCSGEGGPSGGCPAYEGPGLTHQHALPVPMPPASCGGSRWCAAPPTKCCCCTSSGPTCAAG